jgi:hypothetical protein
VVKTAVDPGKNLNMQMAVNLLMYVLYTYISSTVSGLCYFLTLINLSIVWSEEFGMLFIFTSYDMCVCCLYLY